MTMKPDPPTSAAAMAGGPNYGDGGERDAAQHAHAREARANIEKARRPDEVLTDAERRTIERSNTTGSGTP